MTVSSVKLSNFRIKLVGSIKLHVVSRTLGSWALSFTLHGREARAISYEHSAKLPEFCELEMRGRELGLLALVESQQVNYNEPNNLKNIKSFQWN